MGTVKEPTTAQDCQQTGTFISASAVVRREGWSGSLTAQSYMHWLLQPRHMVAATKRLLQRRRRKTSSPDNDLLPTSKNRTHSTRAVIGSSSALQGSHSDTEALRSRIIEQSQEGGCYKRQNLFYGFHCRYLPRTQRDKIITCFYKTNMQSHSGDCCVATPAALYY